MNMTNGFPSTFPTSTVDDHKMPWFHGKINREETERLLRGRSNGTFLIRNSTNFPEGFTLCVSFNGKVEHYRIYLTNNNQYTCDHDEFFDNLIQLVSHYKRDADGLCHRLVTPQVSDAFRQQCESANREEQYKYFERAGVLVPRNELQLGDVIGRGEFGDVLLANYRGKKVAVKTLKDGLSSELLNEAKIMIGLRHQNLVAMMGVVMDDGHDVFMLIEYMANGNLVEFLRSRGRHQVEKEQLLSFSMNVADAMAYMESINLVHRDLAARNVLLDSNFVAKLSDFGLSQKADQRTQDSRGKFPIKWTAPEALRNNSFSNKSDVWSFGVLLWEIYAFGRIPYPRIPIQDVVRHIERGYRMEPPEACPPLITELMNECWALEARGRPPFSEIVIKLKRISSFILGN
ncbi:Tyrosine-protein kinase [Aphelenchoides bicaudatus]|nr:Tyrosine-protein kinase [Aphelenchoides bicaudatus]